ncbi:hypothetical protein NDU88_007093 [Pleurodeles waltl]|uniref:Uncharacterized protein n=1 Tax=Pleurodeles waltl TaxID=8319 RepID=A0AAV7NSN8_PLEWA|nr:hypothetical protein NDU88_007093 [Pleurodeles waltl]
MVRDADTSGCPSEKLKGVAGPRPASRVSGETSGPVPRGAAAGGRDRFPRESANHAVLLLGPTEVRGPGGAGRPRKKRCTGRSQYDACGRELGRARPPEERGGPVGRGRPAPCGATFDSRDKLLRVLAGCAVPLLDPEKVRGVEGGQKIAEETAPQEVPKQTNKEGTWTASGPLRSGGARRVARGLRPVALRTAAGISSCECWQVAWSCPRTPWR